MNRLEFDLEQLEAKRMMAGNVSAELVDDTLVVKEIGRAHV